MDHDTPKLLPPDLRDWVPADHIVHSVMENQRPVGRLGKLQLDKMLLLIIDQREHHGFDISSV